MTQAKEFGDITNVKRVERKRAKVSKNEPVLPPMPRGRVITLIEF